MAITANLLTSNYSTTDATSYTTASVSPGANKLILLAVASYQGSPVTPTATGCGLTWVLVNTKTDTNLNARKITLFRAMGASPSSGAVTIDFSGNTQARCAWSIVEFSGVRTSGSNGANAIVQSATNQALSTGSITVTLSSFANSSNATFGSVMTDKEECLTSPGSGFTEISDVYTLSEVVSLATEFRSDNDTSVDFALSPDAPTILAVAVEIAAEVSSASSSVSPSSSRSPSSSSSPSTSPSASTSSSSSTSPSVSPSSSKSPSASASPSVSPSSSISPSASVSSSVSPSASSSPSSSSSSSPSLGNSSSMSPSSSTSPSVSPSASNSPSVSPSISPSNSVSPSSSVSSSTSPSSSLSPSASRSPSSSRSGSPSSSSSASRSFSPSPSPAIPTKVYSRESQFILSTNKNDLVTIYNTPEEAAVARIDSNRVELTGAESHYLIHQYKKLHTNNTNKIKVHINARSSLATTISTAYLQIWNVHTSSWETLDSDFKSRANQDFNLNGSVTSTNYYDTNNEVALRVYQFVTN